MTVPSSSAACAKADSDTQDSAVVHQGLPTCYADLASLPRGEFHFLDDGEAEDINARVPCALVQLLKALLATGVTGYQSLDAVLSNALYLGWHVLRLQYGYALPEDAHVLQASLEDSVHAQTQWIAYCTAKGIGTFVDEIDATNGHAAAKEHIVGYLFAVNEIDDPWLRRRIQRYLSGYDVVAEVVKRMNAKEMQRLLGADI